MGQSSSPGWKTHLELHTSFWCAGSPPQTICAARTAPPHGRDLPKLPVTKALGNTSCAPPPAGCEGSSQAWRPQPEHTGLQQNATLALQSRLGFPQASHCPTKGKAASVSVEGTANVSTRADTDRVLSQPCPRQQPSTLPPTSAHWGSRGALLATLPANATAG